MKILKTTDFVSERIKVQPITNAELKRASKKVKRMMNSTKLSPDMVKLITDNMTDGYPLKTQKYINPVNIDEEIEKFGDHYDTRELQYNNIGSFIDIAKKHGMYLLNWNKKVPNLFGSGKHSEYHQALLTIDKDKTSNNIYVLHSKHAKWTLEDRIPGELYMEKL